MGLLDTIKEQMKAPTQPSSAGGQTDSIRDLLRAKSGKEITAGTSPRQSSIKEKLAERQTQVAGQELQQKGRIQAEQIEQREADIGQRTLQQEQQFADNLKNVQADFERRSNSILEQFESGQKRLNNQRDLMAIEQLGVEARLQNKQYLMQLQDEGNRKRLDNSLQFKKEMAKSIFADNQALLEDELAFKQLTEADDRTFRRELADMDIEYAMELADNAAKAASAQQMTSGIASAVSGGLQTAEKVGMFKKSDSGKANLDPKG